MTGYYFSSASYVRKNFVENVNHSDSKKVFLSILIAFLMLTSGMLIMLGNVQNQQTTNPVKVGTNNIAPIPPSSAPLQGAQILSQQQRFALMQQTINSIKASGISMNKVFLPNYLSHTTIQNGTVTLGYQTSPAPMGVADYGLMNTTGTIVPYSYTTSSFEASINLTAFSAMYAVNDFPHTVTWQLNAILDNVAIAGNSNYNMWTQNVMELDMYTHTVQFLDNVWNFSSPTAVINPGTIFSSSAQQNGQGQTSTFHYGYSPVFSVSLPMVVNLYLNTSVVSGKSTVWYNVSLPQAHFSGTYDEVIFNSTIFAGGYTAPAPQYLVSGTQISPTGFIPYDAEIAVGGPGGGSNTNIYAINGTLNLKYMNSTTSNYQNVRAAYDAGSQTGETSVGVDVSYSGSTAYLQSGPSLVYGLWNNTATQTKYTVNMVQSDTSSGSVVLTGNVTKDFAGHLLYDQTHASPYGSNNNISALYVTYNTTDLFIGVQENISGNSLVIFLLNNTNSGLGVENMSHYTPWGLGGMYLTQPANDVFSAYYPKYVVQSGTEKFCRVTSDVGASSLTSVAVNYTAVYNSTLNTTELMVPLSEIGPLYLNGVPYISIAAFVVGGSGVYVGTGVPYTQGTPYGLGTNPFMVNNFVSTYEPVTGVPFLFIAGSVSLAHSCEYGWSPSDSFVLPTSSYLAFGLDNYHNYSFFTLGPQSINNVVMDANPTLGVYTPILATSNSQVAAQSSHGNGTSSNAYCIYANSTNTLGLFPGFEQYNDFFFPVFSGLMLVNTNVFVVVPCYNMSFNYAGFYGSEISFLDSLGFNLPSFNSLPAVIYNSSNVCVPVGHFATWYFCTIRNPTFQFYVWNSTYVDICCSQFDIYGLGLFVYNPYSQPGLNTVVNNQFIGENPMQFSSELASLGQQNQYDLQFNCGTFQNGIFVDSGKNLIALNSFDIQYPACSPAVDFFTGAYTPYTDSWNLTNGHGNEYWNFNGTVPFNEYGLIQTGFDYAPNQLFPPGLNLTFLAPANTTVLCVGVFGLDQYASSPTGANLNLTYYELFSSGETVQYYVVFINSTGLHTGTGSVTMTSGPTTYVNLSSAFIFNLVTFEECGLPSGTAWSVNLSGVNYNTVGSSITLCVTNGLYSYVASNPTGYVAVANGAGTIIPYQPCVVVITYSKTYSVNFTETGLPANTSWSVSADSALMSSNNSSIVFNLPNGTYSFNATAGDAYAATANATGTFTVNGANVTINVVFAKAYAVTFTETGLPSGSPWYLNLTGMVSSGPVTTSAYTAYLADGNYTYSVASGDKSYEPSALSGAFTVNGANVSETLTFLEVTYSVTFTESGLPSGTTWYVNLSNGSSFSSSTSTVTFNAPNGSYQYTVASMVATYTPSVNSGSFTVDGAAVSESVSFSLVTYSVTFTESGLPSGTTWYVNLSGGMGSSSSTTSSITFNLSNGSYSYSVSSGLTNYVAASSSGSFSVNGAPVSESVTFSLAKYTITFSETGLASGTEWYVNLTSGQQLSSAATTTTVSLSNGQYHYSATAPGYTVKNGTFNVTSSTLTVSISFSKVAPKTSGISTTDIYLIVGVVVAAVVIGSVVALLRRK